VTARRTRATLRRTRGTASPAECTENSWIPATRVAARRPRTMRTIGATTLITSELRELLVYSPRPARLLPERRDSLLPARKCLSRDVTSLTINYYAIAIVVFQSYCPLRHGRAFDVSPRLFHRSRFQDEIKVSEKVKRFSTSLLLVMPSTKVTLIGYLMNGTHAITTIYNIFLFL